MSGCAPVDRTNAHDHDAPAPSVRQSQDFANGNILLADIECLVLTSISDACPARIAITSRALPAVPAVNRKAPVIPNCLPLLLTVDGRRLTDFPHTDYGDEDELYSLDPARLEERRREIDAFKCMHFRSNKQECGQERPLVYLDVRVDKSNDQGIDMAHEQVPLGRIVIQLVSVAVLSLTTLLVSS